MSHMKRLLAPKFWRVSKKENKFIVSPSPGPHPKKTCIPLKVLLRDILNYAENSLEVKKILNDCKLLGLEYVVIDGSSYGIDLFEPLLKASEKIGVKDIRINGKLMPLWLEHKEGVIALAPRILYEDDAVHHSDELPTLVKYFKSKLSSKIETLIHKDKSINNELISKIKEDDEFAHLNKRTLRKLVSETISKNQKQARE